MLQIISPAKSLDFKTETYPLPITKARFEHKAHELASTIKQLSLPQLQKLLGVSSQLAQLNYERYQTWVFSGDDDKKPAIYAYNGDVYEGIDIHSLSTQAILSINKNLRILSGLYGVLRPSDGILPYRLEMSTPLHYNNHKDLYAYWSDTITQTILSDISEGNHSYIINLASQEYFKAIQVKKIPVPIVECQFKDYKNGSLQMISFFAKKARGMMVRYIAEQNAETPEHLQGFDYGGYTFNTQLSSNLKLVFTR
ncbi:MAG: hypothetical protein BWY22_01688 [Bacteroidetes bacterium ADurb.Bin217]|nr:MAG: hypothetical protein BWY22_01688 [Bacteroidetes bacterium ADurb.Bin217]